MTKHSVAIGATPPRPLLKHHNWEQGDEQFTLDAVCVKMATGAKKHIYQAPLGDGEIAQRLRRYTLCLSRYEVPDVPKYSKRWNINAPAIDATNRIVANLVHRSAYNDDPSVETTNTRTLAMVLNSETPSENAFYKAFSLWGTKAFAELVTQITNPISLQTLQSGSNALEQLRDYGYMKQVRDYINSKSASYRRHALSYARSIADTLASTSSEGAWRAQQEKNRSAREQRRAESLARKGRKIPNADGLTDEWLELYVAKPPLELNHSGKMGRRIIACDTGKEPRFISRMVTDPDKRIFARKTRALGGVVVIDASGSMSLDNDDLERIVKASAGSTVLMYSSCMSPSSDSPNCWVIARNGRRVRNLPEPPGGNGVDGPALVYASKLRTNRRVPIIWVSDGQVTGRRDIQTDNLHTDIKRISRKLKIVRVPTVNQAIRKLKQLQGEQQ